MCNKNMGEDMMKLVLVVVVCFVSVVFSATDPNDLRILNEFKKGLENGELFKYDANDPCGIKGDHVFCHNNRVTQIQVQGVGLKGPLPKDFNQLTELYNIGLQRNQFNGKLPTFKGLKNLEYAYLGGNQFDTIPGDFFQELDSLRVLSLDDNPLNKTAGWSIPNDLENSVQLTNLTMSNCSIIGTIPDFLGNLSSLVVVKLSYNRLTGGIPDSLKNSELQLLWLNNQFGDGLSGPIDVISTMSSLQSVWLHGNQFTGTIPADIGGLLSLMQLNLNGNNLVGPIPASLGTSESLKEVDVGNNNLIGSIPKLPNGNISFNNNPLCQSVAGLSCAPEVNLLLNFLGDVNYPINLASSWKGNDPCDEWLGVVCSLGNVSSISLSKFKLNGTLSPALVGLQSLSQVTLKNNNITGQIPQNLTGLKSLKLLDLSYNNIEPPLPEFSKSVTLLTAGNPLLDGSAPITPSPSDNPSSGGTNPSSPTGPKPNPNHQRDTTQPQPQPQPKRKKSKLVLIIAVVASLVVLVLLLIPLCIYCANRKKGPFKNPGSFVVYPRDPSDPENMVKVVVANNTNGSVSTATGSSSQSRYSSGAGESHVIESGNLVISVQVIRNVTKNFAPENELGRGGFGTVYKGVLEDGTVIAVKRMQAGMITNKAVDEFQAEIAVLSKVRHRHLVSLLGYCTEGNERLLVYEYMPQGALSKHIFQRENLKVEPLSWARRLNIALDVARGMEYLHNLAHQSFIHRDLKSSNILLGDDYRAKVSDFGLVKLAPDGEKSMATRLAGTFGYLAPEYAVTGKISTKTDVFSYGVVLMELLTGLTALDEDRPEESRYLAAWFWHIKSSKEKLMAAIDKSLEVNEDTYESIKAIADLAGHCTAREPGQRPDMGHAVNVLSPLVEKWKPFDEDVEEYADIDYNQPLTQMVKGWQDSEGKDLSYTGGLDDSQGSIPSVPGEFASTFKSADGR